VRLDPAQLVPQAPPGGPALVGGHHQPAAPVGRVRVPGHQAQLLQVVDQVGQHGAVDAELLGDRPLIPRRLPDRGGQHLVAARTPGKIAQSVVGRLDVGPEHHAEHPAQIALEVGSHVTRITRYHRNSTI